jgi:DNA invertase Pin-like site-specific DNA recombinase
MSTNSVTQIAVCRLCDAPATVSDLLGYARVSTVEQDPALQFDALDSAGCPRIFGDRASGAVAERPELARALDHLRPGDTLVVWKLDRLGRNLRHLIETVGASARAASAFGV